MPAAGSSAKTAPLATQHRRAGVSLALGRRIELAARAHRAALVVVGLCQLEGNCAGQMPFSFCARPRCDVPATASTLRSRLSRGTRDRASALDVT